MAELRRRRALFEGLLAGGLVLAVVIAFGAAAARLPLEAMGFGFDWRNYWRLFESGRPDYGAVDIFNPPWTVLTLWPLAALPFRVGWGALTALTLAVLIVSVPRLPGGRANRAGVAALLLSYITLRQLADGNLAAFTVGGCLLLAHGWRRENPWTLAAGALLVTAKYQEAWLLLIVLGLWVLRAWPWRRWSLAAGLAAAVAAPSLIWLGADWLGNLLPSGFRLSGKVARPVANINLSAATTLPGLPAWLPPAAWLIVLSVSVWLAARRGPSLSAPMSGLLLTAGMLLSPYVNEHSLITVLSIAVIPLLFRDPWPAWGLWLLTALPLAAWALGRSRDLPEYVWAAWLLLAWAWFATRLWLTGRDPADQGSVRS